MSVTWAAIERIMWNSTFSTWCFIICMLTISLVSITFIYKPRRWINVTIDIINGIAWILTAISCIGFLYRGWGVNNLSLLHGFMYTVRIFASFIIAAASFDLARHDILQ